MLRVSEDESTKYLFSPAGVSVFTYTVLKGDQNS